eukprot:GHVR01015819.1.p1 GENE.GHVR01015819.1~~GHVR01015819.1.p1  ORF type:complete len:381 (+),score=14.50 GHVR01015819.1:225-1367(+)
MRFNRETHVAALDSSLMHSDFANFDFRALTKAAPYGRHLYLGIENSPPMLLEYDLVEKNVNRKFILSDFSDGTLDLNGLSYIPDRAHSPFPPENDDSWLANGYFLVSSRELGKIFYYRIPPQGKEVEFGFSKRYTHSNILEVELKKKVREVAADDFARVLPKDYYTLDSSFTVSGMSYFGGSLYILVQDILGSPGVTLVMRPITNAEDLLEHEATLTPLHIKSPKGLAVFGRKGVRELFLLSHSPCSLIAYEVLDNGVLVALPECSSNYAVKDRKSFGAVELQESANSTSIFDKVANHKLLVALFFVITGSVVVVNVVLVIFCVANASKFGAEEEKHPMFGPLGLPKNCSGNFRTPIFYKRQTSDRRLLAAVLEEDLEEH